MSSTLDRKRKRGSSKLNDALIKRNVLWKSQMLVTPWIDSDEFAFVGQSLVTAATNVSTCEPQKIEHALERIAVWRVRSQRLPHAIDSSAALAQLLWREHCCDANSCSSTELRLSYASAIIRSINGLADALDQERAVATSIAQRSSQLGIPSWLVEIRHRATHNELPSLAVLRMAASTLLHYFHAVYWDALESKRLEYEKQGTMILEDYRKSCSVETNSSQQPDQTKLSANNPLTTSSTKDNGNVTCNSEGDESDDCDILLGAFRGSRCGTTFNSFAVLQEPKKKQKKDERPVKHNDCKVTDAKSKRTKEKASESIPTPYDCTRRFIKSNIPMDLAFRLAINFLVDMSALIPNDLDMFPQTSQGFKKLRHYHSTFLRAVAREWPGFLSPLLLRLVDAVVTLESSLKEAGKITNLFVINRKLYFLSLWLEFLLSHGFMSSLDILKADRSYNSEYVEVIKALNFPIAFVHDKCRPLDGSRMREGSRVQKSYNLLTTTLASKDYADDFDRGCADGRHAQGSFDDADLDPSFTMMATIMQKSASQSLGCDSMTSCLRNCTSARPAGDVEVADCSALRADETTPEGPWELCDTWFPCCIGMFPSFCLMQYDKH